jgi:hypothetical protein
VERYEILESVEIKVSITNAIDDDDFFVEVRSRKRKMRAKTASLKFQNKEIGLDKEEAIKETEYLISQADADVKFSGLDNEKNKLTGNLNKLKLIAPMIAESDDVAEISKRAFATYTKLIGQGKIAQAMVSRRFQSINDKINDILDKMQERLDDASGDDDESPSA